MNDNAYISPSAQGAENMSDSIKTEPKVKIGTLHDIYRVADYIVHGSYEIAFDEIMAEPEEIETPVEEPAGEMEGQASPDELLGDTEEITAVDTAEDAPAVAIGRHSDIWLAAKGNPGDVSVTLLNPEGRERKSRSVSELLGRKVEVLGYVEFTRGRGADPFKIGGSIYFTQKGLIAEVTCQAREDDIFSEESEACYSLAEKLGLGSVWTKYLYNLPPRHVSRPDPDIVPLNESMAYTLLCFLEDEWYQGGSGRT